MNAQEETTSQEQEGKIHFCTVNVRLYPTIIGHNPATFRGPSLEMDWKPVEQLIYSVDEYEKTRADERREKFVLPPGLRKRFLKDLGYTMAEINEATDAVQEARRLRQKSIERVNMDWKDEYKEERQEFIHKYFMCKPVEVLDYPDVASPGKGNLYYDATRKVKPMFEKIPCKHCSTFACVGEGSDWPASVGMFKCDGKFCKEVNPKVCPVTGKFISGVGYRRSSFFTQSKRLDPKPDLELEPTVTAFSQDESDLPEVQSPTGAVEIDV